MVNHFLINVILFSYYFCNYGDRAAPSHLSNQKKNEWGALIEGEVSSAKQEKVGTSKVSCVNHVAGSFCCFLWLCNSGEKIFGGGLVVFGMQCMEPLFSM